jgi:hypothetical protein
MSGPIRKGSKKKKVFGLSRAKPPANDRRGGPVCIKLGCACGRQVDGFQEIANRTKPIAGF